MSTRIPTPSEVLRILQVGPHDFGGLIDHLRLQPANEAQEYTQAHALWCTLAELLHTRLIERDGDQYRLTRGGSR